MPKSCMYDTRFFVEYFYSTDVEFLNKLKKDLKEIKDRLVSVLVVHEIHKINLENQGKQVALLRSEIIRRDFKVVNVDYETAVKSAQLRSKHRIPLADSVIAASAQIHRCTLVSDDPHFKKIEDLKTKWYN
ncbi:MAG: PIN domain-containing protein [Candidatus Bathyarchaeota archaeon]